jgi:hypothetical protein
MHVLVRLTKALYLEDGGTAGGYAVQRDWERRSR